MVTPRQAGTTSAAPTVVLACDKFKGSATALEVAEHLTRGIRAVVPGARIVVVPIADGGDGTLAALERAGFTPTPVTVAGPTLEPVETHLMIRAPRDEFAALQPDEFAALQPDEFAALQREQARVIAVELADACGLLRLPAGALRPMEASSRGLGEAIRAALELRADRLIVGIGGSASTDGGAGLLRALGARLLDADGHDVREGGGGLAELAAVDLNGLDSRLVDLDLLVATDVDNPLLGERGAAAVFAPQKGADDAQVAALEAGLARLAALVGDAGSPDLPGAGAAGGVGYALALLGGRLVSGAQLVADLVGLDAAVADADLVVTGEGAFDEQTLGGKAPTAVLAAARRHGVPAVVVCGVNRLSAQVAREHGATRVLALTDFEPDLERCRSQVGPLVQRLGEQIGRSLLPR